MFAQVKIMKNKKSIITFLSATFVFALVFVAFNFVNADENSVSTTSSTEVKTTPTSINVEGRGSMNMDNKEEDQNQNNDQVSVTETNSVKMDSQESDSMDNESEQPEQPEQPEKPEKSEKSNEMESGKINGEDQNKPEDTQKMDNENKGEDSGMGEMDEDERMSIERRSNVATAVKEIIKVANSNESIKKDKGIEKEVKAIVVDQVLNQDAIEKNLKDVNNRSGFVTFFIGPKYNKINNANKLVEKNNEHIQKLIDIKTKIASTIDAQKIADQITVLKNSTKQVEDYIKKSESAFSLFGWLSKIFAK